MLNFIGWMQNVAESGKSFHFMGEILGTPEILNGLKPNDNTSIENLRNNFPDRSKEVDHIIAQYENYKRLHS